MQFRSKKYTAERKCKPVGSIPFLTNCYFIIHFNIILPSASLPSKWVLYKVVLSKILLSFLCLSSELHYLTYCKSLHLNPQNMQSQFKSLWSSSICNCPAFHFLLNLSLMVLNKSPLNVLNKGTVVRLLVTLINT